MNRTRTVLAAAAVLATAGLGAGTAVAATTGTTSSATPPECTARDVSFYFGHNEAGQSEFSFDLTVYAHPGVTCRVPERPALWVSDPQRHRNPVPVHLNGSSGWLTVSDHAPLHANFDWHFPVPPTKGAQITLIHLTLPGGGVQVTGYPGGPTVYLKDGITVSAWQTGAGLGEGEGNNPVG